MGESVLQSITGRGAVRSGALVRVLMLVLIVAGAIAAWSADSGADIPIRPLGPAPRGEDGRFENWTPGLPRAGLSVTFPFFLRRVGARFRSVPAGLPGRVEPDVAFLRRNARLMRPTITWVGHATLLVQMGGVSFLTDPQWSEAAGPGGVIGALRFEEPAFPRQELPPIDFVLVSHNHYDHLDLPTLEHIAEDHPRAQFLVPLENGDLLRAAGIENVVELDWGERHRIGAVTIHCLPAQHWSQRGIGDTREALWASWAVTSLERRFYFGGDSGEFEGFRSIGRALGPFDLAAVPIGAYEPQEMMRFSHLDPEQAVDAALDVRAHRMLGIHFGTFDLSDEPVDEPPRRFLKAAKRAGVAPENRWILDLGETQSF